MFYLYTGKIQYFIVFNIVVGPGLTILHRYISVHSWNAIGYNILIITNSKLMNLD